MKTPTAFQVANRDEQGAAQSIQAAIRAFLLMPATQWQISGIPE